VPLKCLLGREGTWFDEIDNIPLLELEVTGGIDDDVGE
jgi:hypothetical protein